MPRLDEAIRRLHQGRPGEAQHILEELRKKDPDNTAVPYNVGICYTQQGMFKASIAALDRCVQGVTDQTNADSFLGVDDQTAEPSFESAMVYNNRGNAYADIGEYRQAIEDYDRSIGTIEQYTQEHFERTGELLPIKGNVLEPGGRTTHKGQILRLYEQGVDPGRDQSRHWSG